jgi:hypothetical protein
MQAVVHVCVLRMLAREQAERRKAWATVVTDVLTAAFDDLGDMSDTAIFIHAASVLVSASTAGLAVAGIPHCPHLKCMRVCMSVCANGRVVLPSTAVLDCSNVSVVGPRAGTTIVLKRTR